MNLENPLHVVNATAINDDGTVNIELTVQQAKKLAAAGVSNFYPCAGSAGFPFLPKQTRLDVSLAVRRVLQTEQVFFPLSPRDFPWEDSNLTKRGFNGFLLMPELPNKVNDYNYRQFVQIIARFGLPMMVYLKPSMTPSWDCVVEMAQADLVAAIKCAYTDPEQVAHLRRNINGKAVIAAVGELRNHYFAGRVRGIFSGGGNVHPYLSIIQAWAIMNNEPGLAKQIAAWVEFIDHLRMDPDHPAWNIDVLSVCLTQVHRRNFGRPPFDPSELLDDSQIADLRHALPGLLGMESILAQYIGSWGVPNPESSQYELFVELVRDFIGYDL